MTTLPEGGCALIEPSRLTVPLGARTHPPGGCCANGTIISGIDMRSGRRPTLPADKGSRGLGWAASGMGAQMGARSARICSRPLSPARPGAPRDLGRMHSCRLPPSEYIPGDQGVAGSNPAIPLVVKFFRIFPDEAPLGLGEILPVLGCHASLHLLRHGLEVALDVGEIFQVGECQAGLRLLHRGLRRVVVRPVAGRGGCALAGGTAK